MSSPRVTAGLLAIAALMVLASLIAATNLPPETYKPRDLVEARYGPRPSEFGLKDYDGMYLGALFFSVDTNGAIYIYDGVKGNVKLYDNDGAFVETIKGVPSQDTLLLPDDMTVVPSGDVYILCEISDQDDEYWDHGDRYRVFVTAADMDSARSVPTSVPWAFARLENGYREYNAVEIVSDQTGSVYLKDRATSGASLKLVDKGKVLSDSAQFASFSEGGHAPGPFLWYPGRNGKEEASREPLLMHETDRLPLGLSGSEFLLGTDSLGYGYDKGWVETGSAVFTRITKYSIPYAVLAVVDSPMPHNLTRTYGKGSWIVAPDGSLYEMIATRESVRVRKWERVK